MDLISTSKKGRDSKKLKQLADVDRVNGFHRSMRNNPVSRMQNHKSLWQLSGSRSHPFQMLRWEMRMEMRKWNKINPGNDLYDIDRLLSIFIKPSFAHDGRFSFQLGIENAFSRRRPHRTAATGPRQFSNWRLPSSVFHR